MAQSLSSISKTTLAMLDDLKARDCVAYLDSKGCNKNDYQAIQQYLRHEVRSAEAEIKAMPKISISIGACISGTLGGWAYYTQSAHKPEQHSDVEVDATLPMMHLMAAIRALEHLKELSEVKLITTDKTIVRTMSEWLPNWKANGWKRADRKPVANRALLERLEKAMEGHKVTFGLPQGPVEGSNVERARVLAHTAMTE